MNTKIKKMVASLCISLAILVGTANCFGKFALIRKMHGFNESVNVGGPWISKIIRTLLMYLLWFVAGWWMFAIDLIILNLIEFWTDSNPVGLNEYNKEGIYTKSFPMDEGTLNLTYMNFGSQLKISIEAPQKKEEFIVLKSEPGKIFKENNGKLQEIVVTETKVSNKSILKLAIDGKLDSSKIVETKEIKNVEKEYLHSL